jgi:alkanesulfonate monooxygenase
MPPSGQKKLHLAAVIYSGQVSQVWRHPDFHAHEGLDVDYYITYAQLAEAAKFDKLFVAHGASFPTGPLAKSLRTRNAVLGHCRAHEAYRAGVYG